MGLATPTTSSSNIVLQTHLNPRSDSTTTKRSSTSSDWKSMSQGFHNQGTFGFSDGFERPNPTDQQSQLIRGEPSEDPTTMQYEPTESSSMFSEMFSFHQPTPLATDLLAREISLAGYRHDVSVPVPGFNPPMNLYLTNPSQHDRQPQPQLEQQQQQNQSQQGLIFNYGGGGGGRQGLDLSLSPSPQELDMTKGDHEFYYNTAQTQHQHQHQHQHNQGSVNLQSQHMVHVGYGGAMGVVNVLRHSKYAKAAQELLEEFCSVGRGQGKKGRRNPNPNNNNNATSSGHGASTSKDPSGAPPALSPSDKFEHQRRKAKLLSMLDEVDRRYNHYCDQMQMVVNSFDSIMGFGSATPYTSLAQKAMSKHFRCLKDAIVAQLRRTCEALGEKDGGSGTGITKGETPRLKLLEQTLRHQRAFHQMGMAEQEAWRPQRGLPENSVSILRAWLFEHFLHPYPSDADKHLLARKTGLSRNQVTNWFINARVRLWKPMVEEMYQQEAKEEEEIKRGESSNQTSQSQRPESNLGYAPSLVSDSNEQPGPSHAPYPTLPTQPDPTGFRDPNSLCAGQPNEAMVAEIMGPTTHMRRGASGDVSLTLGLRQTGNVSENSRFTLRDFNGGG